jgi:hypothetical protein
MVLEDSLIMVDGAKSTKSSWNDRIAFICRYTALLSKLIPEPEEVNTQNVRVRDSSDIDRIAPCPMCRLDLAIPTDTLSAHCQASQLERHCYRQHIMFTKPNATSQSGHNNDIGARNTLCSLCRLDQLAIRNDTLGTHGYARHIEIHIHRKHISKHALHLSISKCSS